MLAEKRTGLVDFVHAVYNTGDVDAWDKLGRSVGVNIFEPINGNKTGVPRARSVVRKVDMDRISNETKQRICEFGLLDYCCLNMPLPPPCENLFCKLNYGGKEEKPCRQTKLRHGIRDTTCA